MNERERFVAVVRGETPDYIPIFGFPGAAGMSGGALKWTHRRLIETGMPDWVGGSYVDWSCQDVDSWYRYWGTCGPLHLNFGLGRGALGIKSTTRIEDGYEIIETEAGEITRQFIDNANQYTMPEFVRFPVRDRASWEFWRDRSTPQGHISKDEMETRSRNYDQRNQPLFVGASGMYGFLRSLWGDEDVGYALHDDPELIHEMCAWAGRMNRENVFPLIERLKPEAIVMGEDLCYNHGMLLSPAQFDLYCGAFYRELCDCAKANGVPLVAVDSDGNVMEFVPLAASYGVNGLYPCEVKAGNDLFALRRQLPQFVLCGWLEKEVVNEGCEGQIRGEILGKVPALLEKRFYFPNGDHGIQPPVTFPNLCKFMTLLHEVCNNPEGVFPRMQP